MAEDRRINNRDSSRFSVFMQGGGIHPVDRQPRTYASLVIMAEDRPDLPRLEISLNQRPDRSVQVIIEARPHKGALTTRSLLVTEIMAVPLGEEEDMPDE